MSAGESMREGERTGEELAGKLASYPGPAYRKAYLKNLLESGNRFVASGNSRAAGYCFAKVAEGLEGVVVESAEPGEPKPKAPRHKPRENPVSPTERVRRQRRLELLRDAAD